jgi:hypothetical protein
VDSDGNKLLETTNTYDIVNVADGSARPGFEELTATRFPQLVRTDHRFYEGRSTPGKTTYTTQQFDEHGNIKQLFDAGDVTADDDVSSTFEYSECDDAYIVGEPTKIVVNSAGRELRRSEATVDCATGNITQARQYLANGTAAISDLDYFDNGNLRKLTAPENLNHDRASIEYTYDPAVTSSACGPHGRRQPARVPVPQGTG